MVKTWVLLMWFSGTPNFSSPTVTAVDGFTSYDSCGQAGNAWVRHVAKSFAPLFACVEKK